MNSSKNSFSLYFSFTCFSAYASANTNSSLSLVAAISCSNFPFSALDISPFSPKIAFIDTTANMINITIVITNATSVIPFLII